MALPKTWYGGKGQANTGSAGALARCEREARTSYTVKRFEIERAAGEGARAPSTNRLVPDRRTFWAKPRDTLTIHFPVLCQAANTSASRCALNPARIFICRSGVCFLNHSRVALAVSESGRKVRPLLTALLIFTVE